MTAREPKPKSKPSKPKPFSMAAAGITADRDKDGPYFLVTPGKMDLPYDVETAKQLKDWMSQFIAWAESK